MPEPLLVAELNLQPGGGPPQERGARVERLRDATAAVPGVRSAAVSSVRLLTGGGTSTGMVAIGDGPMSRIRPTLWLNGTTPGWFATMGIPLRSGRDFGAGDRVGSGPVAIVNETFVRRFLPGEPLPTQPIGQRVRLGFEPGTRYEIVGVVGDTVYTTPREGMLATMYVSMAQRNPSEFWPTVLLTINAAPGTRATVERDVAEALRRADPAIAFTFGTFNQLVEATVTQERLIALVSAFFGGLALLLAAVGLYGVVAHAVRAREKEIGLRIALGAAPSSILRLVFERVGVLIAAGLALGLAGSLWAARLVEALLFHLEPRDPMTFGGAAAVLVAVGVLAAWLPAHRAARLDPVRALREGYCQRLLRDDYKTVSLATRLNRDLSCGSENHSQKLRVARLRFRYDRCTSDTLPYARCFRISIVFPAEALLALQRRRDRTHVKWGVRRIDLVSLSLL